MTEKDGYVAIGRSLMKGELEKAYYKKTYGVTWDVERVGYVVPAKNENALRKELKKRRLREKEASEEIESKRYKEIREKWDIIPGNIFNKSLNEYFKRKYSLKWNKDERGWQAPKNKGFVDSIKTEAAEIKKELVDIVIPQEILELQEDESYDPTKYSAIMSSCFVRRIKGNRGKVPKRFYDHAMKYLYQEWFEISNSYINGFLLGEEEITANKLLWRIFRENEEIFLKLNIVRRSAMVALYYPRSHEVYRTTFYYIPECHRKEFEDIIPAYLELSY